MANNYSKNGQTPRCSFCGKDANMVERLVAGPGVYICNESYPTFKEMYDNADRALYISKNKGKAQYTFFGEEDIDEQE